MSDPQSMRVADADREQLAGDLREHMLAGRLTSEEFEERLGRAYAATTRGELDELRSDLPLSPVAISGELARRKTQLRRRLVQEGGGAVSVSLVCVAIWLAAGAEGEFWPVWVIVFMLLPLVRDAWLLLGPAPDLETVERLLQRRHDHGARRSRSRRHGSPRPPRPPGLSR
jgi:hypothetical protein